MISKFVQRIYNTLINDYKRMFLVFWCLIALATLPAYKAGFNGDFEGLLDYYNKYNFAEFINSKGFNVKSFYQLTHFQLFCFISLFGLHPVPWFLLLTGLHAVNASLVFSLCKRLFSDFKLVSGIPVAMGAALLFLLNPNVTEVTIWKGGYHYLPGLLAQLSILYWTIGFLNTGHKEYAWYSTILFLATIFTLEIYYLTPWFCLLFLLAYYWKNLILKERFIQALKCLYLPQIVLFVFYLICFKLRFGSWVAHYGTTGDFFFTAEDLFPKMLKYLVTLLGFTAHLSFEHSSAVYHLLNKPIVYFTAYFIVAVAGILLSLRFKKYSAAGQLATLFFGVMMLCVAIVSPMFFDETMQLYNSRRCYELSFPVYVLLSLGFYTAGSHTRIPAVLLFVYLGTCSFFAVRKAMQWRQADKIQRAVLRNYRWQKDRNVLILNMPSYYRDIRVIPTGKWDEFQENLHVFGFDTSEHQLQYVSAYNMNQPWDGAHVVMLDSMTLKVTLNQWGAWWMYDLNGAKDFENDDYRLEMKDVGHEYLLYLKRPAKEYTILYQQGEQWRVVNPGKSPGEEQW